MTEPNYKQILRDLLDAGSYNDDGDFVIAREPWDGKSDPPDLSDNQALAAAWRAFGELPQTECDSCGVELTADPPHAGEHPNLCHQCNTGEERCDDPNCWCK